MGYVLLILALCLATAVGRATVLVPAEFREIVTGSEIIVYGRVADLAAEWSDDRKHIDTLVTFEAGTYLKGGPGETITFRVPGGRIGRFRSVMVGAPAFQVGDEAVLFLRKVGDAPPSVFGLNQGVFRVRLDASARRIVVPPALLAPGDAPERVARGASARRSLPLEAFGAQVRSVLAETAGGPR